MQTSSTYLVFGGSGGTGKHFVHLALADGHTVRALVRTPAKMMAQHGDTQPAKLLVRQGSITDALDLDDLVAGADFVICMLGDVKLQRDAKINTAFMKELVPAMRRQHVTRLLYQAGGLSTPYKGTLSPVLWTLRHTLARGFDGQHKDNEAVMKYLTEEAQDIEWMVHRAGIGSDGASKGTLERSATKFSVATFGDCAAYNYRLLRDESAIHTSDLSHYTKA